MAAILFVCEGNVCRSPLCERVLSKAIAEVAPEELTIASAGTRARDGEPMDQAIGDIARALGADPAGHSARNVTAEHLKDASLVLTGTREQRSLVVQMYPRAIKYTLTIRQLGRILGEGADDVDIPSLVEVAASERIHALLRFVTNRRGLHYRVDRTADDVVDPFGLDMDVHELAARQMLPALNLLSATLGGKSVLWPADIRARPLR